MIRLKTILFSAAVIAAGFVTVPEAEAGPLLDWLRGRRPAFRQTAPAYNYYGAGPNTAVVAPTAANNAYGLQPGQCMKTCQQTCSRTVVNYVPYTAYRTTWNRVPVTSYKPVTNTDPCTGCTVTCMRPCTTYTYQMQRVPYTTQRPVYRTETYKVPVTTITNDCATGACNTGCSTCGVAPQPGVVAPMQGLTPTPAPVLNGSQPQYEVPSFPSSVPADTSPSLSQSNLMQPRVSRFEPNTEVLTTASRYNIDRNVSQPTSSQQRPSVSVPQNLRGQRSASVASPVRRDWNYSPIRLASFEQDSVGDRVPVRSSRATKTPRQRNIRDINSIWSDVK